MRHEYEHGEGGEHPRLNITWPSVPPAESIFDTDQAMNLDYHSWSCGAACEVCADRGPNDQDWR